MKKPLADLRIAVLIDAWFPFQGGGQVHVRETIKRLKKNHGCQVVVFHGFSALLPARLVWNILVIPQVIIAHIDKPFNLIHAHAYSAGLSAKILSLILRLPVVYTVHGSNSLDIFSSAKLGKAMGMSPAFRLKYFFEHWLLTGIKYDAQISVAQNFLDYSNINKRIYLIPNGVEVNKLKISRNKSKIRMLFVGRLEKIKGLDLLFQALAMIKQKLPELELRVVGDGSQKRELEALVDELNLDKVIKFLGEKRKAELVKEYSQADIFVLLSLSEGQPLTLLEAWAARLPVIVTRVGNNPYMVEEGRDGFLAKPGSIKSLGKTLIKAFQKRKKWPLLGERGYMKVRKDYTWDKTVKKIAGVYSQVLEYD